MLRIDRFLQALAEHWHDGCATVPKSELEQRLRACQECAHRFGLICQHPDCGCLIVLKAQWRSENCPAEPSRW